MALFIVPYSLIFTLICSFIVTKVNAACNMTDFKVWSNERYTGQLAADPTFWRYQRNEYFVLTQGLATDISVTKCSLGFSNLFTFAAGRSGPVTIQNAYRVMCSTACLESDDLHQSAMEYSGCSCRELSLEDDNYCKQNSARMLCDMLGFCGIWECRMDDFMCPRYEFNKKQIFMKGFGHCIRRKGRAGAKDAMIVGEAAVGGRYYSSTMQVGFVAGMTVLSLVLGVLQL